MTETTHKIEDSLTAQAAWILSAKVLSYALTIAVPLLLARRFDQTEFGLYKQVFLVVGTATAMLPFGFGMSAYYFLPREQGARRDKIVFNVLLFNAGAGIFAALLFFFAPQILGLIFRHPEIVEFAPIVGLIIAFWIFSNFVETLAIANGEPRLATAFIVVAQLTKAVFFIAAAVIFGTITSLIWAAIAQAVLQTVVLLVYVKRRFPRVGRGFEGALFGQQWIYVLPFGLASWLSILQTELHSYFVAGRFSAAEFAVYAVGCFELPLLGILAESVGVVLLPLINRLGSVDNRREIIETTFRVMRKLALVYFAVYAFLLVTAETFITTLFTDAYSQSVPIFQLNLTLLPFAIITLDPISRAYKEIGYFLLRMRVALFIILIPALWFAAQNFSLQGINAVIVGMVLLERAISTVKIMRTIGFQRADWQLLNGVWRTAAAALVAGAGLFSAQFFAGAALAQTFESGAQTALANFGLTKFADFVSGSLYLAVGAIVFVALYFPAVNIFGAMTDAEKSNILNILSSRFGFRRRADAETTVL